jgi:uncharacterized protein YktB (UPF0637 family)
VFTLKATGFKRNYYKEIINRKSKVKKKEIQMKGIYAQSKCKSNPKKKKINKIKKNEMLE